MASMAKVLTLFDHESDAVMERCEKLVSHGADNYIQFLPKRCTRPVHQYLIHTSEKDLVDATTQVINAYN